MRQFRYLTSFSLLLQWKSNLSSHHSSPWLSPASSTSLKKEKKESFSSPHKKFQKIQNPIFFLELFECETVTQEEVEESIEKSSVTETLRLIAWYSLDLFSWQCWFICTKFRFGRRRRVKNFLKRKWFNRDVAYRKKNGDGDEECAQGHNVVPAARCGLRGMECTIESSTRG